MSWRLLECPECGDTIWKSQSGFKYCDGCFECGTFVQMEIVEEREMPPTKEELAGDGQ